MNRVVSLPGSFIHNWMNGSIYASFKKGKEHFEEVFSSQEDYQAAKLLGTSLGYCVEIFVPKLDPRSN